MRPYLDRVRHLGVWVVAAVACTLEVRADEVVGSPRAAPAAGPAIGPSRLAPLQGEQGETSMVALPVAGFGDAVVSIPVGATSSRPVVVAAHGLSDSPEGICDTWRSIIDRHAWVLCPRGQPSPDKTFRYRDGPALANEVDAALAALAERYPRYVDRGPVLYAGFSRGAILGAWVVTHDPARFPTAVLTEGGEDGFDALEAAEYARGGGKRVLFACGLKPRVAPATRTARVLERAGVQSRVVLGKLPETGQFQHRYDGPVAEETKGQLDWLFEGDARWALWP
jgi:hypothetical protein